MLAIRPYRPEDRDEILDVWEAANRVGHPFFDEAKLLARRRRLIEVHLPAAESWVAWDEGRIVGGIGLDGAFVGGLFVAPEHHGQRHRPPATAARHDPQGGTDTGGLSRQPWSRGGFTTAAASSP